MARPKHVNLLIIGNGAAGGSAAFAARAEDPKMSILIIGKEPYPEYSAPALPDYLSGELPLELERRRRDDVLSHVFALVPGDLPFLFGCDFFDINTF